MKVLDRITTGLGLGFFYSIRIEGLARNVNNTTLGIHAQEWDAEFDVEGKQCTLNELYIGFLFFRIVLEFVMPND